MQVASHRGTADCRFYSYKNMLEYASGSGKDPQLQSDKIWFPIPLRLL
jgi:hypothetical protein